MFLAVLGLNQLEMPKEFTPPTEKVFCYAEHFRPTLAPLVRHARCNTSAVNVCRRILQTFALVLAMLFQLVRVVAKIEKVKARRASKVLEKLARPSPLYGHRC